MLLNRQLCEKYIYRVIADLPTYMCHATCMCVYLCQQHMQDAVH